MNIACPPFTEEIQLSLLDLSSKKHRVTPPIDDRISQIIAGIYTLYEPHPEYLVLKRRMLLLKTTLEKIVKRTGEYFQNPINQDCACCQIDMRPLDDIDKAIETQPFVMRTKTSIFCPNPSEEDNPSNTEEVESFQNKLEAKRHTSISFYVNRQWKIWRLPHKNQKEKIFESSYNVIYKIFNISEGKWDVLKILPQPLSDKLGPDADATLLRRFQVLNAMYKEVQVHENIQLQEPPFTSIYMRLASPKPVLGLVENYYPDGDLFKLISSPNYSNIPLITRLIFCCELTKSFHQLIKLGIYHPDIKTENILIQKTALGSYQLAIGDYVDCLKLMQIFDKFKTILDKPKIPLEDADYIKTLRYVHTKSYTHKNDIDKILYFLRWRVLDIFRIAGEDPLKRSEKFEKYKKDFAEIVQKHQIFALGISFYQILIGSYSPYPEEIGPETFYCGESDKKLIPSSLNYLSKGMQIQSPHSKPVLMEKISQFVITMLDDDFRNRPNFETVCMEFEKYVADLLESPSPKKIPISKHLEVPRPTRKRSPGPTALALLMQHNRE